MSASTRDDGLILPDLDQTPVPPGVDRRAFMMRSAVVGAVAVITGCKPADKGQGAAVPPPAAAAPKPAGGLSQDLEVVKKAKGPMMTTIDEFYKVGPGPVQFPHHRADADHL